MAAASYLPGGWLGLIRPGTVVVLDPGTPASLVRTVWDLLATAPDAAEVLHALTGGFGALSASPCFGIIGYGDSLRVFLRGDIDLTAQLSSGPVTLDGRNVTTWTERWLDAPEWFSVAVPAAVAVHSVPSTPDAAVGLPVVEGAVHLQSLRLGLIESGDAAAHRPGAAVAAVPPVEESAATLATPGDGTSLAAAFEARPALELQPECEASAETVAGLQETITGFTETAAGATGTLSGEAPEPEVLPLEAVEPQPEEQAAAEFTSSYDHLWDKTVVRSIEGAAVRTGDEDDGGAAKGQNVVAEETAAQEVVVPETAEQAEELEADGHEDGGRKAAPGEAGKPLMGREAAASPPAAGPGHGALTDQGGLIDSVPWAIGADRAPSPPAPAVPVLFPGPQVPAPSPGPQVPPSSTGPQAPPSFIPAPGSGDTAAEGDHDGQTILKSNLPGSGPQPAGPETGGGNAAGNGPLVLARVCPGGHANPPTSSQCFTCAAQLPDVAVQVPRPRLGRLRLSTGELIDLDQSLVIGRQPSVSRVQGGTMPRLVQVASPGGDISRSHVEVRLEGWHVMLCDLKATNGTVLVREGQPPRRLAQNEMAIVLDGDIAELGDDVSLRFEEIL